jgi:pantoate--beta-alanine ligase
MSSRNAYLSNQERKAAQIIFRALTEISGKIRDRGTVDGIAGEFSKILSIEPLVSEIQYASVYDPLTLEEIKNGNITGEILLAVAVKIGGTRLIDNMLVTI